MCQGEDQCKFLEHCSEDKNWTEVKEAVVIRKQQEGSLKKLAGVKRAFCALIRFTEELTKHLKIGEDLMVFGEHPPPPPPCFVIS